MSQVSLISYSTQHKNFSFSTWEAIICAWIKNHLSDHPISIRAYEIFSSLKQISCLEEMKEKEKTITFEKQDPPLGKAVNYPLDQFVASHTSYKAFASIGIHQSKMPPELCEKMERVLFTNEILRLLFLYYCAHLDRYNKQDRNQTDELDKIKQLINKEFFITISRELEVCQNDFSIESTITSLQKLLKNEASLPEFYETATKNDLFKNHITLKQIGMVIDGCYVIHSLLETFELYHLFNRKSASNSVAQLPQEWGLFSVLFFASEVDRKELQQNPGYIDQMTATFSTLSHLNAFHKFVIPNNEKLHYAILSQKKGIQNVLNSYQTYSLFCNRFSTTSPQNRLKFVIEHDLLPDKPLLSDKAPNELLPCSEEHYLEAATKLIQNKKLTSLIESTSKELQIEISFIDWITICRYAPKLLQMDFLETKDARKILRSIFATTRVDSLPPYQQILITLEIINEASNQESTSSISILKHAEFLKRFEIFLSMPLPPKIIFSCLVYHDLNSEKESFPDNLCNYRSEFPFTRTTLDSIQTDVSKFQAPTKILQPILGADAEYKKALTHFAMLAIYNPNSMHTEFLAFCPRTLPYPQDPLSSHFFSAGLSYHEYMPVFIYEWISNESKSCMLKLSILKNPRTLETITASFDLGISQKELKILLEKEPLKFSYLAILLSKCVQNEIALCSDSKPVLPFLALCDKIKSTYGEDQRSLSTKSVIEGYSSIQNDPYSISMYQFTQQLRAHIQKTLVTFSSDRRQPLTCNSLEEQASLGDIYVIEEPQKTSKLSLFSKNQLNRTKYKNCFSFDTLAYFFEQENTIKKSNFLFDIPLHFLENEKQVQRKAICVGTRSESIMTIKISILDFAIEHSLVYPLIQKDENGSEVAIWQEKDLCRFIAWQTLMTQSLVYKKLASKMKPQAQ